MRLICNHLYCKVCVEKIKIDDHYVCYFDGFTSRSITELAGLKQQLLAVVSVTNGGMLGPAIENHGIRFDKLNIPCKFRGCGQRCPYDHSGKYFKKTECPFRMTCPNISKCIFQHTASLPQAAPASALPSAYSASYHSKTTYCVQCGQAASETQCTYCNVLLETCTCCGTSGNLMNFKECQYCQAKRLYCTACQCWGQWGAYFCYYCQGQLC